MNKEWLKVMQWWAHVRWFLAIVLFAVGLLHIKFQDAPVENAIFFGTFFGVLLLNITYHLQMFRHNLLMMIVQVVLDTLFATIVVHLTGGLNSIFVWVYLIAVITASLSIPKVGGIFAGLCGSLSLLLLLALYQNKVIEPTQALVLNATYATIYVLSYTGLFSGMAFVATYLSDLIQKELRLGNELEEYQKRLSKCQDSLVNAMAAQGKLRSLTPLMTDLAMLKHDINTPLCVISLSLSRVKRAGLELNHEGLQKSDNEITESVNAISTLLERVDMLKKRIQSFDNEEIQP